MFDFSKLLLPVVQAPMAGGITTPELVAAVANGGGVGSFGFAYSSPEKIQADLAMARSLTSGPLNANFFVFSPPDLPCERVQNEAIRALQDLAITQDLEITLPSTPYYPDLMKQLEPVWQARPAMLTFHFGLPPAGVIERAHVLGIGVGITATNLIEAGAIEAAGADFIVAQGIEAGGHRGQFDLQADDQMLGTHALIAQLVAKCAIPIVAAGGIMNGADIKAVIRRGAQAAQLGTAFICCDESGAPSSYKKALLEERSRGTLLTKAFSGRYARGLMNAFTHAMAEKTTLPFPLQNTLTAGMRQKAAANHDPEYQSLWAGTAYGKVRDASARVLLQQLRQEMEAA